jgi:dihydrolipoamide dehydrogenase
MEQRSFDVIVIGSGPGGYVAAIRASQLGLAAALVERGATVGGTCLNVGCIPAKALLDSTELFAAMKDSSGEHGISFEGLGFDLAKMMERKLSIVDRRVKGLAELLGAKGIETIRGSARIEGKGSVTIVGREGGEDGLSAKHIIIATGSAPVDLPFLPFDGEVVVSSDEALSFERVPDELLVVGGGAIGLELGSVWSRLGSRVTVIELLPRIAPGADEETARTLSRELAKQGIAIRTGVKVKSCTVSGHRATLACEDRDGKQVSFNGDKVLVAVGRRPVTDGLGLEQAGVDTDAKSGKIKIDKRYMTSVAGIYAIGDVVEGPMLAHRASEEGVAVAEILSGKPGIVNYEALPAVIYTWPELAGVGLTEEELGVKGVEYAKGTFAFKGNGRAVTSGNTAGFVKILAHAKTDRVLGAHVIGPWASDLVAEIVSVIEFGGSSEDIARTIHAHPTLSEAVKEAAMDVEGRSIHSM